MLGRSLGALIFRNVVLAGEVLESDDVVDRYRDQIFERLMVRMSRSPVEVAPNLQFVLATRYLERIGGPLHEHCRGYYLLGSRIGRSSRTRANRRAHETELSREKAS